MEKITTHLWFDKEAVAAAELYTSIFNNSHIGEMNVLKDTPSGDVETVNFTLEGEEFSAISAGPYFKFNPSISLFVACENKEEVQRLYEALIPEGSALMELGEYPFSEKYAWIQDKFGLSWQFMYMEKEKITKKLIPTLMFVGENYGKAVGAINFYTEIFEDSQKDEITYYEEGEGPDDTDKIKHAEFVLNGKRFAIMESGYDHQFQFNEAISFIVSCETQERIDYYWEKMSAVPVAEQCGWLKDKFGVSWQIVPADMDEMLKNSDDLTKEKITQAFLKMKKFDLAKLRKVYMGETS